MKKQITRDDIVNAKAIHLYNEDTIYIQLNDTEDVYGTHKGGEWFIKRNFWDYWESSLMLSYFRALTADDALKLLDKWQAEKNQDDHIRLNQAIVFATDRHSGQFRKSTAIPYILHPLEVLQILYSMRADTNVMIAGVLHDTVEDTDTTLDEIREMFGDDVAELVASNSEDKTKSWEERKQHTISELSNADTRVKMLIMADKVSNLRSIATDYRNIGDELWSRFNAPKEKQSWYYSNIHDSLYDMQFHPQCADIYWEFAGLYKDVFVRYYHDETNQIIYQVCDDIDVFRLKKGNPQWVDISSPPHNFSYDIIDNLSPIGRKEAELLEDMWNKPFWDCHNLDMQDGFYGVFRSENCNTDIKITNQTLAMHCEDYAKHSCNINGRTEYEFSYSLDDENTHRLLVQLRMKHGLNPELTDIFKKEFGSDNSAILFENMCKKLGISYTFSSH